MRPLHNKLRIVNKSRPTSPVFNLIIHRKIKTEQNTRHLCIFQNEKFDGLAGFETKLKMYCGPCLLFFCYKHEVCNKQGFTDLNNLLSVQKKHSKSQSNVHCYLQLKIFLK